MLWVIFAAFAGVMTTAVCPDMDHESIGCRSESAPGAIDSNDRHTIAYRLLTRCLCDLHLPLGPFPTHQVENVYDPELEVASNFNLF